MPARTTGWSSTTRTRITPRILPGDPGRPGYGYPPALRSFPQAVYGGAPILRALERANVLTMRTLLSKITSARPVAMGLAVGLVIAGIGAVIGGSYANQVVHDQLAPQNIYFPASAEEGLPENLSQYAGQKVDTGAEAKAYAEDYIGLHLQEMAGGKTYSEVSTLSRENPDDEELAGQRMSLFMGETLKGLLLNAWGWSVVGTVATVAGWTLIGLGAVLFALPLAAVLLGRREATRDRVSIRPAAASGD